MKRVGEKISYQVLTSVWNQKSYDVGEELSRKMVFSLPMLQSQTLWPDHIKVQEEKLNEIL